MARHTAVMQLEQARRLLSIATTDADVQTRLAQIGYDAAAIAHGQALYDAALRTRTAAHAAQGSKVGATVATTRLREQVEQQTGALAQIARTVFEHDADALETLGMRPARRRTAQLAVHNGDPAPSNGDSGHTGGEVVFEIGSVRRSRRRSEAQGALLDRARTLYDNALADADLLAALERVGYPRQRLETERATVAAFETQDTQQESYKAAAKAHTANQQAALKALNDWVGRLRRIARPALRDRPDLLDKLGI